MGRCIVQPREALREVGTRSKLCMRDEIDQEIVEELDELGTKLCGVLEEQRGDGARDLATALRDRRV